MPRRISFALTTAQARNRTKTVTRRKGWVFLKPGDVVQQIEKGMGLKKGEKQKTIHLIRILSNRPEPLSKMISDRAYGKAECILEGFPDKDPEWFVDMYCRHNRVSEQEPQNRIEFEYLD